ncbi:MAG TPA: glycosyltransferase family 2 protein [Gemmatimonadaceae bacterium]|nr:glycosyltransferase family 2 protein [Gemmatimonadaceae bacterium]
METVRLVLAAGVALAAVVIVVQLVWGHLSIPSLRDVPPASDGLATAVIVAARDEERHIRASVSSLLSQTYPALEVIVVNDRSTDATGTILDDLAREEPRLRVVHVDALPDGWLGKNHAMQLGARAAGAELLIFADGDVVMAPDAIARASRLMTTLRIDHLAVAPDMRLPTWPLALVVNYFMMWFLLYLKPWRAQDPKSTAFIGIGAFNMVRASAFHAVDGFARIALRPDDDIMLGKLLKRHGHRQLLATADGTVAVEWYQTLGELARGFRKNAFAGMHYSLLLTIGAVAGNVVLCIWPFIAAWITSGAERWLYLTAVVAQIVAYAGGAFVGRTRPWLAILYPVAAVLFVSILTAAVFRTLRRRGIEWRGTFYALDRLRANRI